MIGDPVNWVDLDGLTPLGAAYGAAFFTGAATLGSLGLDAVTGGLNILATPAEIAMAAAIGAVVGDIVSDAFDNIYEMGKGERGYSGIAGGTKDAGKHWKDDPNKPDWGWQKDPQTGKKTYKRRPPYLPDCD